MAAMASRTPVGLTLKKQQPITIHLTVPQAKWLLLVVCLFRKMASGNPGQMADRIAVKLGSEITRETGESINLDGYLEARSGRN